MEPNIIPHINVEALLIFSLSYLHRLLLARQLSSASRTGVYASAQRQVVPLFFEFYP